MINLQSRAFSYTVVFCECGATCVGFVFSVSQLKRNKTRKQTGVVRGGLSRDTKLEEYSFCL